MQVIIEQLCEDNLDLLRTCDPDIFDAKIDRSRLEEFLSEANHILLVAINNGIVIGQVSSIIQKSIDKPSEIYIDNLAVSEEHRRKGVATKMLREIFKIGASKGCRQVWLATEPENEKAKRLYQSLSLQNKKAIIFEGDL